MVERRDWGFLGFFQHKEKQIVNTHTYIPQHIWFMLGIILIWWSSFHTKFFFSTNRSSVPLGGAWLFLPGILIWTGLALWLGWMWGVKNGGKPMKEGRKAAAPRPWASAARHHSDEEEEGGLKMHSPFSQLLSKIRKSPSYQRGLLAEGGQPEQLTCPRNPGLQTQACLLRQCRWLRRLGGWPEGRHLTMWSQWRAALLLLQTDGLK